MTVPGCAPPSPPLGMSSPMAQPLSRGRAVEREDHPDSGTLWPPPACPVPVRELGCLAPDQKPNARSDWSTKGEVVAEGEGDDGPW